MPSLTTIALLALAATTQALPLQPSSTSLHTKRLSLPIWPWEIPGSKPAGVKKIIAFGDSLSDNGNTFRILNNTYPYTSRYFGGRYSNGRTWVEYLSETLKVPLEDYAYGGSSTDDIVVKGEAPSGTVVENMPGMVQQVEDWRKTAPTFDAATTLFTVWSGANDYFNAKFDIQPEQIVAATMKSVNSLTAAGAKNIVVFNMPPGQKDIPFIEHNLRLGLELLKFSVANPSIKLVSMDMTIEFAYIALNRQKWGFDMPLTDVTKPCLTKPDEYKPEGWIVCENPDKFIMYDVHPTTKTHSIIAEQVGKALVKHNIIAG